MHSITFLSLYQKKQTLSIKTRKYLYSQNSKIIYRFASNELRRFNFKSSPKMKFLYLAFSFFVIGQNFQFQFTYENRYKI